VATAAIYTTAVHVREKCLLKNQESTNVGGGEKGVHYGG
jgi:hypothetical protein